LILERLATLQEIETWYSLDDVMDANFALDTQVAAQKKAEEGAKK
jgi:hypothetical protein